MKSELEIKRVPFLGTELVAARDSKGQIWAGIRWMCDGMGLSEGQRKRQIANIQTDKVLSKGGSNLILPTRGGNQETLCLKLDFVPLWLAKISITPTMELETPELAATLEQYQLRSKDVLAAAFLPEQYSGGKKNQFSLSSVNNAAKILDKTLTAAGIKPQYRALTMQRLYRKAGVDIQLDFIESDERYYLKEAIAERLGVMSRKSGAPHAAAIGAIIDKLAVSDSEKVLTTFERNGHEDHVWQYSEDVVSRVDQWLSLNGHPNEIRMKNGKTCHVAYRPC